jgi:hypothetical protein
MNITTSFCISEFSFSLIFSIFHTIALRGKWWRKFKQTNILQNLTMILLLLCTLKNMWCKHFTSKNNLFKTNELCGFFTVQSFLPCAM